MTPVLLKVMTTVMLFLSITAGSFGMFAIFLGCFSLGMPWVGLGAFLHFARPK